MPDPVNAEDDLVERLAEPYRNKWIGDHEGMIADLHDTIRTALEAVRSTRDGEIERWQPIETAPLNKTHVALLRRNSDKSVTYGHGYYMPLEGWRCWHPHPHGPPTHWFPLPDPFARQALNQGTDNVG